MKFSYAVVALVGLALVFAMDPCEASAKSLRRLKGKPSPKDVRWAREELKLKYAKMKRKVETKFKTDEIDLDSQFEKKDTSGDEVEQTKNRFQFKVKLDKKALRLRMKFYNKFSDSETKYKNVLAFQSRFFELVEYKPSAPGAAFSGDRNDIIQRYMIGAGEMWEGAANSSKSGNKGKKGPKKKVPKGPRGAKVKPGWNRMVHNKTTMADGSFTYEGTASTADGIFTVSFKFSDKLIKLDQNKTNLPPTAIKTDVTIANFPFQSADSAIAMLAKVDSKYKRKKRSMGKDDFGKHFQKEVEITPIDMDGSRGIFSWANTFRAKGADRSVLASDPATETNADVDLDGDRDQKEKGDITSRLWFSFPDAAHNDASNVNVFWDPVMGVSDEANIDDDDDDDATEVLPYILGGVGALAVLATAYVVKQKLGGSQAQENKNLQLSGIN